MFAVKGWSVPASALKTQTLKPAKSEQTPAADAASKEAGPAGAAGQKRKRANKDQKQANVSEANVADLYASVIEKEPKGSKAAKPKPSEKRQKVTQESVKEASSPAAKAPASKAPATKAADEKPAAADSTAAITLSERGQKRKTMKDKKREKKAKASSDDAPSTSAATEPHTISAPAPAKVQPKLTPLQASMRQKLVSARFRHLNQTLYTTPSAHSLSLFSENPEMFHEYHEGFRRQVEVWPENPVDTYIETVRRRGKVPANPRGKGEHPDTAATLDKIGRAHV